MAVRNRAIGKFIAIDQDKETLLVAEQLLKDFGQTFPISVLDIIREKTLLTGFDFIYTAGLYDYLPNRICLKLTTKLFNMLNPGGRLLIANFLPNIPCRGFMEAQGDWWLIYRNEEQLKELFSKIPNTQVSHFYMFVEVNQNIAFAVIEKIK